MKNEMDDLKEIYDRGSNYWKQVLDWGVSRGLLSDKEQSILRLVVNMFTTFRTPSEKQIKVVMDARQRMIREGMPLEFK